MNVQFVIVGGRPYRSPSYPAEESTDTTVYVLEVNPRSSRTVPFISKVTDVPMVHLATRVILGKSLRQMGYRGGLCPTSKYGRGEGAGVLKCPSSPAWTGTWGRR